MSEEDTHTETPRPATEAGDEPEERLRDRRRLEEIAELDLLSPEVGALLQDVTDTASTSLGLPVALVTVVLGETQHFAASAGLEGWLAETRGTPVEWSFCTHALDSGQPFVVKDARTHPRLKDNPLVQHDGFRCYAGIPLVTSRGHTLGTLCVLGHQEHSFSARDLAELRGLAAEAVRRIEARRQESSR